MNEKNSEEIRSRRLAFKLFDKGKSPAEILAIIPRSRSWLCKWKKRVEQKGRQGLDSVPQAPHPSPQSYSFDVVKLVVRVRKRLEKRVAGQVGPRAIQQELVQCRLMTAPPGRTTLNRWLKDAGLSDSPAESDQAAYDPEPQLGEDLVSFACDWTERYFTGGEQVFVFHTIALRTPALAQTLRPDKSPESAWEPLLACGSQSGLPDFLQIDNDAAFTGVGRTPHVFGRFVRLASVQARVLVMPCRTDLYFLLEDAEEEARYLRHGLFMPIESIWGHWAGSGINEPDRHFIDTAIKELLAEGGR